MNFKLGNNKTPPPPPREEPILDMKQFARDLDAGKTPPNLGHLKYAPPAVRNAQTGMPKMIDDDRAVGTITAFGELPIKEITEIRRAARAEVDALDRECEDVCKHFHGRIKSLLDRYDRIRKGVKLSMNKLGELREEVVQLDEEPAPPVETATPDDELGAGESK